MISKLIIENFRSHKNTVIDLCLGINCFIGKPNSGKTNIIRALNWLITNRPLGFRFHSKFAKDPTVVEIQTSTNDHIKFTKSKTSSEYVCNEETYGAVGSDVPDEISKILNLSDLNFQWQLDQPFLITESPGEVAKLFNKVLQLSKADQAVSLLTTDINLKNKQVKALEQDLNSVNETLEGFPDVENLIEQFEKIKLYDQEISDFENSIKSLATCITDCEQASNRLDELGTGLGDLRKKLDELFDEETKTLEFKGDVEYLEESIRLVDDAITNKDSAWSELNDLAKRYRAFLNTLKVCPFCEHCKEPVKKHNLDLMLKDIKP